MVFQLLLDGLAITKISIKLEKKKKTQFSLDQNLNW